MRELTMREKLRQRRKERRLRTLRLFAIFALVVAVYAGMVLLYNPWFAVLIITLGILLIVILNTGVAAPMLASILFHVLIAINGGDKVAFLLAIVASTILVFMHHDNISKALAKKDDYSTKDFLTKFIFRSDH